jgi:hypothetical protein
MNETVEVLRAGASEPALRKRGRPRFFQIMSALLLLAVLAGFAPTFFLRPLTGLAAMHWYLWVHGLVLTAWFVLSLVQISLVAARRTDLHRRLGVWGAWLAGAVVLVGIFAIWAGPHDAITGTNGAIVPGTQPMDGGPFLNAIFGLTLFAIFVAAGILMRRKIESHRRLMLMASIAIIFPAAGRIPLYMLFWLQLPGAAVGIVGGGITVACTIGMPIALLVYDFVTRRRPHAVTVAALAAYFPLFFGQFLLGNAPIVRAAITALE